MARLIAYAHAAQFSSSNGFNCMRYSPFSDPIFKEEWQLNKAEDIEDNKRRVLDQLKAENPRRGFFVDVRLASGERAPRNFKSLKRLEYDPADHGFEPEAEAA